ncbi:MAG: sigma-70 family RNA polymerase sigma factor [Ruminococcus sp.]|nr:sigma-70 family RNA polymerase sigma factor [Ruminococcus sp.]
MSDNEILTLLAKDSRRGFEALVSAYAGYIAVIVRSRLGDMLGAEEQKDAAADIFAEAYRALSKRPDSPDSLKAFLSVTAARYCAGIYRRKVKERNTVPIDDLTEQGKPEPAFERTELTELLKTLGEPDCEIFLRRYFLGQKSAEIASALGLTPGSVDQRISRGLKKLRERIGE